jgi:hypothetical protein
MSPQMHLGFHTYDRESKSLDSSSSGILHYERANKIFRKYSMLLIDCFFKFVITSHLPLHRVCVDHRHRLDRAMSSHFNHRQGRGSIIHSLLYNHVFHTEYDDLCRHYLLDNLLQCLICIIIIYLVLVIVLLF